MRRLTSSLTNSRMPTVDDTPASSYAVIRNATNAHTADARNRASITVRAASAARAAKEAAVVAQKKAAADAAASVMTACAAEVQLADKEAVAAAAMSAADLAKGPFPGAKFFRSDLTASTQRESNTRARGSKAATARTASAASATESAFRRKESHAAAAAYEEPVTFPQLAQHSLYKKKAGRETEAALLQLSPAVRQKFAREAGSVTMATVTGSVGDAAPTPPGTARTASAARLLRVTCWVFLVSLAVVCAEVYLLLSYVRLFPEDASSAQPPKQLLRPPPPEQHHQPQESEWRDQTRVWAED